MPRTAARDADVLVVGGGLAGASVATHLARAGHSVTLLEQHTTAHNKVCGEFLSHEALHYLRALGVDAASLGAVPITAVRFCSGKTTVERSLPFSAMSLTRCRLDEALLQHASRSGVSVLRERVESLDQQGHLWVAATTGHTSVCAPAAFLATGKHDLRGHGRPSGRQNSLIGIKMYFRLAPDESASLRDHVELFTFPGGYAGLQPVEEGAANLCALIDIEMYKRLRNSWPHLLAHMERTSPHLARRLAGAEPLLDRPLAIARIPYGLVRGSSGANGLWLLGDQAAVIPSFSGDGMSIALHSARIAAQAYLHGESSEVFARKLRQQLSAQVRFATLLSQALVSPALLPLLRFGVWAAPGLLTSIASGTRIRRGALDETIRSLSNLALLD